MNDSARPRGGAERVTLGLRDGLRARGHEVRLLASRAERSAGPGEEDYGCWGSTGAAQTPLRALNPSAALTLERALRRFRPDVVHLRMFLTQISPAVLPSVDRVPAIYHAATHEAVCPKTTKVLPNGRQCERPAGRACRQERCLSPQAWVALLGQRFLLHRWRGSIDRIVANSSATAGLIEADGLGPVEVVHNGCAELPPGQPASEPKIGFLGRFEPEKGAATLLHAFETVRAAIPKCRLVMVGDGPERAALQRSLDGTTLADCVELTGRLSPERAIEATSDCWAIAVPSRWPEPFGMAAVEAMVRGIPVVASSVGALPELVGAEHGVLVPPDEPDALAVSLIELLRDGAARERIRTRGRALARERFSHERFVERFESIYAEVGA